MTVPIDISRSIAPDAAVYPGDDPLGVSALCSIGPDAPCNVTALHGWTTHFLTHVDPPRHFVANGDTLEDIVLARFMGDAIVVEVDGPEVSREDVPESVDGINVLFKTANSHLDPTVFHEDHVYISLEAVEALIEGRPNLVGIDYLSVDRFGDEDYPAHKGLLGAGILLLEGLDLADCRPGRYTLAAFPLKISQGDGSPVRAVLLDRTN